MLHPIVLVALAILSCIWFIIRKGHPSAPGPKGWPIVGNAPDLAANPNLVPLFRKWAEQYGSIMQFSVLGTNHVVISSQKDAHELLVKRAPDYDDRGTPYAMRQLTRELNPALMDRSDTLRRERKLVQSIVSISATKKYLGLMADESAIALDNLINNPVAYRNAFLGYSYSVLTRILLGFSVPNGSDSFVVNHDRAITEGLQFFRPDKYPSNLFPLLGRLPSWLMPSNGEVKRQAEKWAQNGVGLREKVAASIKDGTAKESTMKHFLENREDYDVTDEEADGAFASLLGGGTRSPYNNLLGYVFLMMLYPEWQQRLQDALDEVVGPDRLPTMDDIPRLPIVRAIVKEGVRFRSIVGELGIPRQLNQGKDDTYAGYFFKGGTIFHVNYGSILMDKEMYPDQQDFNPDRWLNPKYPTYKEPLTVHPNCQNFEPFGHGRRQCPGYHIAEMTLVIMVARLAWSCTVRRPIDPATKLPVELKAEFEPNPNPSPLPFPCEIEPRSEARVAVVKAAAKASQ